jgi:DNA-binding LytR/AlgR family response regulator
MTKRTTHINRVRQITANVKMQVQNLLGWDDMQYAAFQEAQGYAYLNSLFANAPLADHIPEHKEYWSWWKLHWLRRDREFLDMAGLLFPGEYQTYYEELHTPDTLAFRPHAAILERTYTAMIHQLTKNAVIR